MQHIDWLTRSTLELSTVDAKPVEIWEFCHEANDSVISEWAKHFRNHYCSDDDIDFLREGTGYTREEYLINIKFPDEVVSPGPSIRAGDFSEILICDYLQYILGYWVPRTRYDSKTIRNESTKGSDIIAFDIKDVNAESLDDTLIIFEAKSQFSGIKAKPRLSDAIKDSAKDKLRISESLNALKQRLRDREGKDSAKRIARFQSQEDNPFEEIFGAAAIFSSNIFDEDIIKLADTKDHPYTASIKLLVIHGLEMMSLVNKLYKAAASCD